MGPQEVDHVVNFLNSVLVLDPVAIERLIETRVACNDKLVEHPTVVVMPTGENTFVVGFLGMLNGILGVQSAVEKKPGCGRIAAYFNDDGKLTKFIRIDQ